MAGTRRSHALVLFRITSLNRQRLLPVFPVFIFQQDRNRRANGLAVTHAGDNVDAVSLNLHASAAAKALLPAPEFTIEECLVDVQASRYAGKKSHQALSVRFSGSKVTQHGSGNPVSGVLRP